MFRKIVSIVALSTVIAGSAAASVGASGVCARTHIVQRGETLYRIARAYGTNVNALRDLNGISNVNRIYAGQSLCITTSQDPVYSSSYTVQRGDTLARIARNHGVSMTVLAEVNNILNPDRIYVGQVLVIPDVTIQF